MHKTLLFIGRLGEIVPPAWGNTLHSLIFHRGQQAAIEKHKNTEQMILMSEVLGIPSSLSLSLIAAAVVSTPVIIKKLLGPRSSAKCSMHLFLFHS